MSRALANRVRRAERRSGRLRVCASCGLTPGDAPQLVFVDAETLPRDQWPEPCAVCNEPRLIVLRDEDLPLADRDAALSHGEVRGGLRCGVGHTRAGTARDIKANPPRTR